MNTHNYNQTTFLLSAADLKDLPPDRGREIAIIGRSNAGKSSAINAITNIKGLARTSKTPGRTQLLNVFVVDDSNRLVDLPGYGYAKAPAAISKRWMDNVNTYLQKRRSLRGLILVMDIRHPLKEQDRHLIEWCVACELPIHILLTKTDKLKNSQAKNSLLKVTAELEPHKNLISIQLFSANSLIGLDEAHALLDTWFTRK